MNTKRYINDLIISYLEDGVIPWQDIGTFPVNVKSRPYSGINAIILLLTRRKSPVWGTKKAWEKIGITVKDTELPTNIFYRFRRLHPVYNEEQVCGFKSTKSNIITPEKIIEKNAPVVLTGNSPMYMIREDKIICPAITAFVHSSSYYVALLHELTHWTGHSSRLARKFGYDKSDPFYAFEELVAELGSALLCAKTNISGKERELDNHVQYIESWIKMLRNREGCFLKAAALAQKSTDYLLQS